MYVHRRLSNGDIYWINNRKNKAEKVNAVFRVAGKAPEIWHPETGKIEKASYEINGDQTTVSLNLSPNDAVFVVFTRPSIQKAVTIPASKERIVSTIEGSWMVSFQPDRGAPASAQFDQLRSWTENSDSGIKYFSGTATYSKIITAPEDWLSNKKEIWIDLGNVQNLAEVVVNGNLLA